jgi:hydroxyethylthiazole kinase-like uncharacterized protein yjeF
VAVPLVLDDACLAAWPLPVNDGGKSARGTVLVLGGSPFTGGAVLLCGLGALRMGAGRLQLATAAPVSVPLSLLVPEALVLPVDSSAGGELRPTADLDEVLRRAERVDALVVGPGMMGSVETAAALLGEVLGRAGPHALLVLDALALGCLPQVDAGLLHRLAGRLILTPNASELDALLEGEATRRPGAAGGAGPGGPGPDGAAPDLAHRCAAAARRYGAVVTCFGTVAAPDGTVWRSDLQCPGLGTSGSGDVLAGLCAGAAARSGDAARAACWATYVHLRAGVSLCERGGALGFLARELLEEIPAVLHTLERWPHAEGVWTGGSPSRPVEGGDAAGCAVPVWSPHE